MNGRALPFVPRTTPGQVEGVPTSDAAAQPLEVPTAPPEVEAIRTFATMAELSLIVERMAINLHEGYAYLDGRTPETDPYDRLTADQKALLRNHAIVAIQSLCPWLHAAASIAASRVSANFDRGLDVYVAKLTKPSRVR